MKKYINKQLLKDYKESKEILNKKHIEYNDARFNKCFIEEKIFKSIDDKIVGKLFTNDNHRFLLIMTVNKNTICSRLYNKDGDLSPDKFTIISKIDFLFFDYKELSKEDSEEMFNKINSKK